MVCVVVDDRHTVGLTEDLKRRAGPRKSAHAATETAGSTPANPRGSAPRRRSARCGSREGQDDVERFRGLPFHSEVLQTVVLVRSTDRQSLPGFVP